MPSPPAPCGSSPSAVVRARADAGGRVRRRAGHGRRGRRRVEHRPVRRGAPLPDDPDAEAAAAPGAPARGLGLPPAQPWPSSSATPPGGRGGPASPTSRSAARACTSSRTCAARTDHDGRPLAVTLRAVADEVAAAADLVKGKADGIPAALVRGLDRRGSPPTAPAPGRWCAPDPGDWFALGHVEAVRTALGVAPGSAAAEEVGRAVGEPRRAAGGAGRAGRGADAARRAGGVGRRRGRRGARAPPRWRSGAADDYDLGRLVTRSRWRPRPRGCTPRRSGARGDGDVQALAGLRRVLDAQWRGAGLGVQLLVEVLRDRPQHDGEHRPTHGSRDGDGAKKITAP